VTAESTHGTGRIHSCLVVGTGLIGTSVALALGRHGVTVHLADHDPVAVRRAADLGAGDPTPPLTQVDLAVVAVSPSATGAVAGDLLRSAAAATVVDTAGVKAQVLHDVRRLAGPMPNFVGTHPMAGRERSGPGAAQADLFEGRPWVLVEGDADARSLDVAATLLRLCGAMAVRMTADEHDAAVALVSHVPHVAASLVAARLAADEDTSLSLAGQGVTDVTRIAASDPELWVDILASNAGPVSRILRALRADLDGAIAALDELGVDPGSGGGALRDLLVRGNSGRSRLPGKHGAPPTSYVVLPVVVADRPGELARLLTDAGKAGVNVEDVRIEHSRGQPVGLVELSVQPGLEAPLAAALTDSGWVVHW
jgi:prephenate dehydrogenase